MKFNRPDAIAWTRALNAEMPRLIQFQDGARDHIEEEGVLSSPFATTPRRTEVYWEGGRAEL